MGRSRLCSGAGCVFNKRFCLAVCWAAFATFTSTIIEGYGFATLFGLFLTGTFLEEVFYRGYLIERITILTRHRWAAAFVSWLLFTLVHLKFFGLGPTIDTSVISAALVLLYMKEKSIWPCIVVHGINDALAFLIFPLLI